MKSSITGAEFRAVISIRPKLWFRTGRISGRGRFWAYWPTSEWISAEIAKIGAGLFSLCELIGWPIWANGNCQNLSLVKEESKNYGLASRTIRCRDLQRLPCIVFFSDYWLNHSWGLKSNSFRFYHLFLAATGFRIFFFTVGNRFALFRNELRNTEESTFCSHHIVLCIFSTVAFVVIIFRYHSGRLLVFIRFNRFNWIIWFRSSGGFALCWRSRTNVLSQQVNCPTCNLIAVFSFLFESRD